MNLKRIVLTTLTMLLLGFGSVSAQERIDHNGQQGWFLTDRTLIAIQNDLASYDSLKIVSRKKDVLITELSSEVVILQDLVGREAAWRATAGELLDDYQSQRNQNRIVSILTHSLSFLGGYGTCSILESNNIRLSP